MQNLATGLIAQFSPRARRQEVLNAELDEIIGRLARQQQTLERRLSTEARGTEQRHLKIRIEVGRLQLKKALNLRTNLTSARELGENPRI